MRVELRNFICDYQENVARACQLLRDKLNLKELGPFCWRSVSNSAGGWLDDAGTVSYYFHGIGCRVEFGTLVVDFDFGSDGRFDGFDAWRLSLFAESVLDTAHHSTS